MSFDPKQHMTNLKGKDYLGVNWRLVWFREVHPNGIITTDVQILTDTLAIVKATICNADGDILSTGTSTIRSGKGTAWAGREVEKAETSAIGRALGHSGFGTQFDGDDEGDYLADSPVTPQTPKTGKGVTPAKTEQKTSDTPPAITISYEEKENRTKKVYAGVKIYFDEDFGKFMKACGEIGIDWNLKSDVIIQQIKDVYQ